MDQVQVLQAKPGAGVDERYWHKWYCENARPGHDTLYLQMNGSWGTGRFYFDTEGQARGMLSQHHPSASVCESCQPPVESYHSHSTVSDDDDSSSSSSSIDLGGLLGGGDLFSGGGGDFGGGGAGGDW